MLGRVWVCRACPLSRSQPAKWSGPLGAGWWLGRGPCPREYDDLATAWTSSASAHPATSLLALPVVSSLPCPALSAGKEGCRGGAESVSCPRAPGQGEGVLLPMGCLPGPELCAFALSS